MKSKKSLEVVDPDWTGLECFRCHTYDGVEGVCPYDEEINGKTTECTCCKACRNGCADEI